MCFTRVDSDTGTDLLGTFISYDENKLLWIRPQGEYSQNFQKYLITKVSGIDRYIFCNFFSPKFSDENFKIILIQNILWIPIFQKVRLQKSREKIIIKRIMHHQSIYFYFKNGATTLLRKANFATLSRNVTQHNNNLPLCWVSRFI